jgi:hypothetical protein
LLAGGAICLPCSQLKWGYMIFARSHRHHTRFQRWTLVIARWQRRNHFTLLNNNRHKYSWQRHVAHTSLRRMSTDPVYPTNNGTTDTNNVNDPSVLWKLPK